MKTLYFLIFFLPFSEGHAQNTFNNRIDFGRSTATVLTNVEVNDSCYYVCGIAIDTLWPYKTGTLFGKINMEGEVIWYKAMNDSLASYSLWNNSLSPTEDGNFIVMGYGSDTISMAAILLKFNSEGDTVFTRKYKSPYFPQEGFMSLRAGIETSDNGFLLSSNISNPQGTTDISLIKTDSLGNIEWDTIYGGTTWTESAGSVTEFSDSRFIVGAWHTNINFVNINYVMRTSLFQIDGEGNIEWEYLSPSDELQYYAVDVLPASDGGYVIASGKGTEYVNGQAGYVVWQNYVYKIDANREFEWGVDLRSSNMQSSNVLSKLLEVSDGSGYIVIGQNHEPDFVENGMDNYGIISKISLNGDSLWTRYYQYVISPQDRHIFYDIEETPDGGFIMVGEARDALSAAEPPRQQAWIVKVDQYGCLVPGCQLIDAIEDPVVDLQLSLYPNPTTDYLNIFYYQPNHRGEVTYRIIDLQGRVLRSFSSAMNNVTHVVSVGDLAAGQYVLNVENGSGAMLSRSFVKN